MPTHPPEETTEASIRDVIEGRVGSVRGFRTRSDDIVGSIDLLSILRGMLQSAMLGYSVDATREGRGYATEGARAVVRFAFDELNLHRVEASYRPTNERSSRVVRKLGFVVEGYARDYLFLNDAWHDGILVSLTNARWRPV
jgi:ribosomal-protein-alanine N-acetyltransferase